MLNSKTFWHYGGIFSLHVHFGYPKIKSHTLQFLDTIGLSIFFCLQQKKRHIKKPKKEAKVKVEYRHSESNLGRSRESQVS